MMDKIVGLLLIGGMAAGSTGAGMEMYESLTHMARTLVTKMEMKQIGQLVMMYSIEHSQLPVPDYQSFIRKNMTANGRDPALDLWGTPYWLEYRAWNGQWLNKPVYKGDFVLSSAGSDKSWKTTDDLVWENLSDGVEPTVTISHGGPGSPPGVTARLDNDKTRRLAHQAAQQQRLVKATRNFELDKKRQQLVKVKEEIKRVKALYEAEEDADSKQALGDRWRQLHGIGQKLVEDIEELQRLK